MNRTKRTEQQKEGVFPMAAVLLKAASFLCIIFAGFLLKKLGVFTARDYQTVKNLIFTITLPAAVISSFGTFQRDMSLIAIAAFGLLGNALFAFLGWLISRKRSPEDTLFMMLNTSGYNIGTFAMPYLQAFLGAEGILVACIFDCGNAILCSGLTNTIACAVTGHSEEGSSGAKGFFKHLFSSVPFDVYSVLLVMYALNLRFPAPVYTIAGAFGGANTFLAMFMIGGALEFSLRKDYLKTVGTALGLRYAVTALLCVLIFTVLPYSLSVRRTLTLLMVAPVTSMAVVFSSQNKLNEGASGMINSCSIIISLVIMTALITAWGLGA